MKKVLLTSFALFVSAVLLAQIPTKEKQALEDLYAATNGEQWTQAWELNQPVTEWNGVTITDGHVTAVSLMFNNLTGTLPSSLENLEQLQILELSFNKIEGTLPSALGNLSKLEVLALNGNNLTGIIPTTIGNLTSLRQLHLSSNTLTGQVPNSVSELQNLEVFNVFDNELYGELPQGLAQNFKLQELMVAENNFSNTQRFSVVILANSGATIDLNETPDFIPADNTVLAIEGPEDEGN